MHFRKIAYSTLRKVIRAVVQIDLIWIFLYPFSRFFGVIADERKNFINAKYESEERFDKFNWLQANKTVRYGPFRGMKYGLPKPKGSTFYPKLMGTYERELHTVFDEVISTDYRMVINIGCGEGYYAVGLAVKNPSVKVMAFDTDMEAQRLTRLLAEMNGVSQRIEIGGICTPQFLQSFPFSSKTLILCDCEGYEKFLFDDAIGNLSSCDLLIETHDFIDIDIADKLQSLFSATHHITVIQSVDDIHKAKTYHYQEASALSKQEKMELFREGRPAIMEWLFLKPKAIA